MRKIPRVGAVLAAVVLLGWVAMRHAARAEEPPPMTLAGMRDHYRPLLLFAPSDSDPALREQLRILREHEAGVRERDMLVVALPMSGTGQFRHEGAGASGFGNLSAAEAQSARRRFQVAPGSFAVVLIGKDGGEKVRSAQPIAWERLRDTIDAMPMRRDEMRRPLPR